MAEVLKPVEGCIVNWVAQTQVNPITGETFDFEGQAIPQPKPVLCTTGEYMPIAEGPSHG